MRPFPLKVTRIGKRIEKLSARHVVLPPAWVTSGKTNPMRPRMLSCGAGRKFRATPVSNLVLFAFDTETGKQLYSSEKIMTSRVHFSEPVVAAGKVFVVSWDAHVYAFGLKQ
jgi:outer membrane protein assembly factor BamB